MAKGIIKYALFNSSEDFEIWQKETDVEIFNISPIISSAEAFDTDSENPTRVCNVTTTIKVFVTYEAE